MKLPGVSLCKNLLKQKCESIAHTLLFVYPKYKDKEWLSIARVYSAKPSVSYSKKIDKLTNYLLAAGAILLIYFPKSRGNFK